MSLPVLWSFRRCPYAMRARLALDVSGIAYEHREILLSDKPAAFLAASPKGTVPVMVNGDRIIEESIDIMLWALDQNDPQDWLDMPDEGFALIRENDGPFKTALDRFKYHTRFTDVDIETERLKAAHFLQPLDQRLRAAPFLFGSQVRLADMAIFPFIRQFANADRDWFDAQQLPGLQNWLDRHLASDRFARIMVKHAPWEQ